MIRRSGVTPASNWSNSGRGTLRRCANGQMRFEAVAEIGGSSADADARISG